MPQHRKNEMEGAPRGFVSAPAASSEAVPPVRPNPETRRHSRRDRQGNILFDADKFFWAMLALALLLSGFDIYRRLRVEWGHRIVAIAVEYRDLVLLSRQSGEPADVIFSKMRNRGAEGITVSELTGKDLAAGFLPVAYGSLATFKPVLNFALSIPLDRAAILIDNDEPILQPASDYLRTRMKDIVTLTTSEGTLIVLPTGTDELADSGVLPDFAALNFAESVGTVSLYRPSPAPGVDGMRTAASLRWLKSRYPSISCVIPAGQIVSGYPELGPVIGALNELDIPVAQAEFVRQIGISELYSGMMPRVLPLHSLVRDELISRRMSRAQVIERMVRAVHERSIRILLLRPYELYSVGKLEPFLHDMQEIRDALNSRGYDAGWPEAMPMFKASVGAALGIAIAFLATLWSYSRRYFDSMSAEMSSTEALAVFTCSVVLGLAAWRLPFIARMMGGFATAFIAAEASIWALDRYEKPFHGLVAGLLIVLAGGAAIAAFYGTTAAMLRLAPFSGVKLTLLLPPALILLNDLNQRIHPESAIDIMARPPLWGELLLVGALAVGAVVLTVRSDNASFVPGWEIGFRDMLERILWVRPRTKEFLVGYPCLIVYYIVERRGWAARYREALRLGASMAFASAVNSFCHFHTLLPLTVMRVVNGWCLGIAVGFAALMFIDFVGTPIWKGAKGLFD